MQQKNSYAGLLASLVLAVSCVILTRGSERSKIESKERSKQGLTVLRDQIRQSGSGSDVKDPRNPGKSPSSRTKKTVELPSVRRIAEMRTHSETTPEYLLVDNEGRLTSQAVSAANLTGNERLEVQRHYDDLKASMKALLKRNLVPLKDLEVGNVTEAFRINPFEADGEAVFGAFFDKMKNIIGPERAWKLAQSIPVGEMAGQFGSNEVIIKITAPSEQIMNSPNLNDNQVMSMYRVEAEFRDPVSGKEIGRVNTFVRRANETFFGIF